MIDVAHHGDHHRPRHQRGGGFGPSGGVQEALLLEADVLDLEAELLGDAARRLHIDDLLNRHHRAERHQLALHLRRLDAELTRQLGHADATFGAHDTLAGLRCGCRCRPAHRQRISPLAARRGVDTRIDHAGTRAGAARHLPGELLLLAEIDHLLELLPTVAGAFRGAVVPRSGPRAHAPPLTRILRRGSRGAPRGLGLRPERRRQASLRLRYQSRLGLGQEPLFCHGHGRGRGDLERRQRDLGLGLRSSLAAADHRGAALSLDAGLGDHIGLPDRQLLAQQGDLRLVERRHGVAEIDAEGLGLLDELVALDAELFRDLIGPDAHAVLSALHPFACRPRCSPPALRQDAPLRPPAPPRAHPPGVG